jgi:heme-degrading monooxygenase HmoA
VRLPSTLVTSAQHFVAIWKFRVKPECVAEFVRAYAPDGSWAQLFGRASGFISTSLIYSDELRGEYVTIDRWQSRDAYQSFRAAFAAEYAKLDEQFQKLTVSEESVFEGVDHGVDAG